MSWLPFGRGSTALAADADDAQPLVRVRNLRVAFDDGAGERQAVGGVSFDLAPGRCVALVGESGSGKSVTARSLVGLNGPGARVQAKALEQGLVLLSCGMYGNVIRFLYPLTIPDAQFERAFSRKR